MDLAMFYNSFCFQSLKIQVPKWVAMSLTMLQIVQMVLGVTINVISLQQICKFVNFCVISVVKIFSFPFLFPGSGKDCNRPMSNIYFAFGIYFSYLILFGKFFWKAYIVNPMAGKKKIN